MSLIDTEGIVIRTFALADADKIAVVLTPGHGLIRGVAKGAKRLKSRFGSALEPMSVVRIEYFRKETAELASIRDVELIESSFGDVADPAVFQRFAHMAEMIGEFAAPDDPNERLYRMTRLTIGTARRRPELIGPLTLYFEFWLLRLGGFLPDWSRCEGCRREFGAGERAFLRNDFRLACGDCGAGSRNSVAPGELAVFRRAGTTGPEPFAEYAAAMPAEVAAVSAILRRVAAAVLGRDAAGGRAILTDLR